MKFTAAVIMAAAIGTCAEAKQIVDNPAPVVTVCINAYSDTSVTYRAKAEASKMFAEIPIRIDWSSGRSCQASGAIHIHFRDQTPEGLKPGALAYALPYEGTYIELFYDRIKSTVGPSTLPHLLAHVLVHEITHILQGVARHSETGVMKAHWTTTDYREMEIRPMHFAPEDIELVQASLRQRAERLQAKVATPAAAETR